MKFTYLWLICLVSFMYFTYVQCDGEEQNPEPPRPRRKHPVLREVFLTAPQWLHIPFSLLGALASYAAYHFYG
uniref:Hypotheticial protein n=1 Tax=Schistosoma japonicum TaxID=6182 RepID=C1L4Q1_SCHJA|nr:hypotheticial protein [Schistosoma japonicum]